MGTTQPIKSADELLDFTNYYKNTNYNLRNYTLIILGLHTALRISDILHLKWGDVYDFRTQTYRNHLIVHESKTDKQNTIALKHSTTQLLEAYRQTRCVSGHDYIFTKATDFSKPLCRSQAFRIVKRAAEATITLNEGISCHSLRKTFGYFAWKQGTPPALLMEIYNHSSYRVTKKYLGISQDEKDDVFLKMHFS